jgi:hypothetical protein
VIVEGLYALLKADTALMALVPGGVAPGKRPQGRNTPQITYHRIGNEQPPQSFGNPPGPDRIEKGRIQISIWAHEEQGGYPAAVVVEKRLKVVLDGRAPVMAALVDIRYLKFETTQELYEDEDRVHHFATEFSYTAIQPTT